MSGGVRSKLRVLGFEFEPITRNVNIIEHILRIADDMKLTEFTIK